MKAGDEQTYSIDENNATGGIDATTQDIFTEDALDPVYQLKARVLNNAIQEVGMGRYQVSCSRIESSQRLKVPCSGLYLWSQDSDGWCKSLILLPTCFS